MLARHVGNHDYLSASSSVETRPITLLVLTLIELASDVVSEGCGIGVLAMDQRHGNGRDTGDRALGQFRDAVQHGLQGILAQHDPAEITERLGGVEQVLVARWCR